MKAKHARAQNGSGTTGERTGQNSKESIASGASLHVPCRVYGTDKTGAEWKGDTTTISISLEGAHLILPEDVELKDRILILFKIPEALRILSRRKTFTVVANLKIPETEVHLPAPHGKKIMHAIFEESLSVYVRYKPRKT